MIRMKYGVDHRSESHPVNPSILSKDTAGIEQRTVVCLFDYGRPRCRSRWFLSRRRRNRRRRVRIKIEHYGMGRGNATCNPQHPNNKGAGKQLTK